MELAQPLKNSVFSHARSQWFEIIAAIARFDEQPAEKMLNEESDDVDLADAPAYFRALVALHPDQVWSEYQSLPHDDVRGIDYQQGIRNWIMPALSARDDTEFWNNLTEDTSLRIDPRIVGEKQ